MEESEELYVLICGSEKDKMSGEKILETDTMSDVCRKTGMSFVDLSSILSNARSYTPVKDACFTNAKNVYMTLKLTYDDIYKISCKLLHKPDEISINPQRIAVKDGLERVKEEIWFEVQDI